MDSTLSLHQITKSYDGVLALDAVDLDINARQIHALVGKNGAGKSTLVKVISGVVKPDQGRIVLDGADYSASRHRQRDLAISHVFQHIEYFPSLSVGENVFMGREGVRSLGRVKWEDLYERVYQLLDRFDLNRSLLQREMGQISVMEKVLVQVVDALSRDSHVFIFDEPTAALEREESERLLTAIRELRDEGAIVIYISHRIEEIMGLADVVSVLRDGRLVASKLMEKTSKEEIVEQIVGEKVGDLYPARTYNRRGAELLRIRGVSGRPAFADASFSIHEGEIVGLAGLLGAGRSELAQTVFGVRDYDEGSVEVRRARIKKGSPDAAIRAGIAYLPENRQEDGLVLSAPLRHNATLAILRELGGNGLLRLREEQRIASTNLERLSIKAPSIETHVANLSGGNQQKVLLGKWLNTQPEVLLLDEPTQGIDVKTKAEIHQMLDQLAREGKGILMISSDTEELVATCDRIIVMHEGRIVREFDHSEATIQSVLMASMGASQ